MTKLLEQAINQARKLSPEDQDAAADVLFAVMANAGQELRLTADQIEEVERIRERLKIGGTRLATEEKIQALWKKCGA